MGFIQLALDGILNLLSMLLTWLASLELCPAPDLLATYVYPVLSQNVIAATLINDFIPLGTLSVIAVAWIGAIPWAVIIRFFLHKLGVL